jgi:hypothetical protein
MSVGQLIKEFPRPLRNPKVHQHVHKCPLLNPNLRRMNSDHTIIFRFKKYLVLSHIEFLGVMTFSRSGLWLN